MEKIIKRRVLNENGSFHSSEDLLREIFRVRGSDFDRERDYQLTSLELPQAMKGVTEAVALLKSHLDRQSNVLIVGDFDADGATSTAVCMKSLRSFGFRSVDFLVPNRFEYGYGLTEEIVGVAAQWQPGLIITVDNGISSIAGVQAAKEQGMDVLVTDHHLPGNILPEADVIVNPNQPGCGFSSKNLAGVGVIFYVMSALRTALRRDGWFEQQQIPVPNMADILDLVALGTVADVVPLDFNNRVLVDQGLRRIRAGKACRGVNAILNVANRSIGQLVASDLGFAVGPRLNAAGRLDDMSLGIRCLLAESSGEAKALAEQLDDLNKDRRLIETSIQSEAEKVLASISDDQLSEMPTGVCLYKEDWHQGVIGIVASRIKDKLHRPTIVFAKTDSGELKGSGRSIPGVHLRDVLDEVATRNTGLLTKFGGHAMAAGLSLAADRMPDFMVAFNECVKNSIDQEGLVPTLHTDGALPEGFMEMGTAEYFRDAGPWGQAFPEPTFDGEFYLVQQRLVGQKHLKMVLSPVDRMNQVISNKVIDAIAFNIDLDMWPNNRVERVRVVYRMDVNEFRGARSLQFMVDYIEAQPSASELVN